MKQRYLNIVGSFADQPQRALVYSAEASALGYTPRIVGELSSLLTSGKIEGKLLFTDDTSICEALDWSREQHEMEDLSDRLYRLSQFSDKFKMRGLTNAGFEHDHYLINGSSDNVELPEGEWLCKPRWGSNSRNVAVVSSRCQLRQAVSAIIERGSQALVERHIVGRHLCLELCWDGHRLTVIGSCEKAMTNYQTKIVEAFHSLSDLPEKYVDIAKQKLEPFFQKALEGIPCILHGEFIVEDQSKALKIAELNPRAPWGLLPEFFSLAGGTNFDRQVVANSVNAATPIPKERRPVVLGAVFSETFFERVDTIQSRGNTLFIERFQKPSEASGTTELTKLGRYLLWGTSPESVAEEWSELSKHALTDEQRKNLQIDTSKTWQSKCC